MNYYVQIISSSVTALLIILWLSYKKVGTKKEAIFFGSMLACFANVTLDTVCELIMANIDNYGRLAFEIVAKAYLFFLFLYIYYILRYYECVIFNEKRSKILKVILPASLIIFTLAVIVLKLEFVQNEVYCYFDGPALMATYAASAFYSILIIIVLIKYRKSVKPRIYVVMVFWFVCLLGFAAIQTIDNEFMVLSLGFASGIYYVYIILENPANNYNYNLNCFNKNAFGNFLRKVFNGQNRLSLVVINVSYFSNSQTVTQGHLVINELLRSFINRISSTNNIDIFEVNSDEIAISSDDFSLLKQLTQDINKDLDMVKDTYNLKSGLYISLLFIKNIVDFKESSILLQIFNKYKIDQTRLDKEIEVHMLKDDEIKEIVGEYELINKIDTALENDEFDVVYHLIDNKEDNSIQAEAELRFIVDNKIINYDSYCELASKFNRSNEINSKLFNVVCAMLTRLPSTNKLNKVFIKITANMLENKYFVKDTIEKLSFNEINEKNICFEITDAQTILKRENLISNVFQLQKYGITFSISGFGKGESNINYFIDLPLQSIIYNKDIIKKINENSNEELVIKELSGLAHILNIDVIMDEDSNNKYAYQYADMIEKTNEEIYTSDDFINLVGGDY